MSNTLTWCCTFVLLLWGSVAQAVERLAVLELTGEAAPADQRALLTDTVRGAVVKSLADKVQVMTRENMEVMLTDMGLDADCVAEGACEVETARNLGVDYVISGSIVKFGEVFITSLKLHGTGNGALLGSNVVEAESLLGLLRSLDGPARELVGPIDRSAGSNPVNKTAEVDDVGPRGPQPAPAAKPYAGPDMEPRYDLYYQCNDADGDGKDRLLLFFPDGKVAVWSEPPENKRVKTFEKALARKLLTVPYDVIGNEVNWERKLLGLSAQATGIIGTDNIRITSYTVMGEKRPLAADPVCPALPLPDL